MKYYTVADLPPYPKDIPPTDEAIADWIAPVVRVSPRTVEAWPIHYKKVVGKRVRRWEDVGTYVVELFNGAPLYRGGRRRAAISPDHPAKPSPSGNRRQSATSMPGSMCSAGR